jgi:hypothetical protein
MKYLCLALLISTAAQATPTRITLLDALTSNQVKLIATGNSVDANPTRSTHTGLCLKLKLTNVTSKPIECQIEEAYHLQSVEERLQDLIITENKLVALSPQQTKEVTVNALCGEKNNGSPSEKDTFILKYKHQDPIQGLTHLLEQYKTFDNTAQQAMWCLTDNNSIESIYDTHLDTLLENKLVHYVAAATKRPIPSRTYRAVRQLLFPLEIEGSYAHFNQSTTTIGFYLTDSSNHVYRTILDDDTETRRGDVKYSYLYRGQFPKGTYYFKMKMNGEWKTIKEITL